MGYQKRILIEEMINKGLEEQLDNYEEERWDEQDDKNIGKDEYFIIEDITKGEIMTNSIGKRVIELVEKSLIRNSNGVYTLSDLISDSEIDTVEDEMIKIAGLELLNGVII